MWGHPQGRSHNAHCIPPRSLGYPQYLRVPPVIPTAYPWLRPIAHGNFQQAGRYLDGSASRGGRFSHSPVVDLRRRGGISPPLELASRDPRRGAQHHGRSIMKVSNACCEGDSGGTREHGFVEVRRGRRRRNFDPLFNRPGILMADVPDDGMTIFSTTIASDV